MLAGFCSILGGVALFLFGIQTCRQSFQSVGGWLHRALFKLARGRFKPFLFGTALTVVSQNSTIATSLAVSFVDIGVMNLSEAILAMSGASFGGGIVIFLISLNIVKAGPAILFLSLVVSRMAKSNNGRIYGRLIQGIAMIFVGMTMIQSGVVPIVENPMVHDIILWCGSSFLLSALAAFLLTSIIQNNTAVVAIGISIASSGLISPISGMAIVLGSHIGSTTLVVISSLSGKLNAKRLGVSTVIYKFIGAVVSAAFIPVVLNFAPASLDSTSKTIVLFQVTLATANSIVMIPFYGMLRRFAEKLIPPARDPATAIYLNQEMQNTPAIALELLARELTRLSNFVEAYFLILFTLPQNHSSLSKLQENLGELFSQCRDYFTGIPIPPANQTLRQRYYTLSVMVDSLEIMTNEAQLERSQQLAPEFLAQGFFQQLASTFMRTLRYSFRFFVLGDEDIIKVGERDIAKFRKMRERLTYKLMSAEKHQLEHRRKLLGLLEILGRIVNAAEHSLKDASLRINTQLSTQ